MLYDKNLITEEEREFIILFQNQLIDDLRGAKKFLAEEEIAYCLKMALESEKLRLVIHNL